MIDYGNYDDLSDSAESVSDVSSNNSVEIELGN